MRFVEEKRPVIILLALIIIISVLHYSTTIAKGYFHEIYKLLYYIPIILAAFYFGIKGGLLTSLSISLIYLPHVVFQWRGTTEDFIHRLLEIVLYNVAAYIVGRLSEGERNERKKYERVALELQESYEKLKHQSETLAEVEEQLRHSDRLSVMGELAASLAHEVRNPLGSIKGTAEILQDDYSREHPNYQFLQILIKEVDRLNHVIENFLSLARPKSAAICDVNLQEAVNSVVHIVSAKARKEKVAIECHLPHQPIHIKADENKFRQVLLNLLLNAMAASDNGDRISIDSRIENHDAKKAYLELSVADTGSGIPESELKNIFNPFYTTKEHGTGLGLPITKRITEEYNWDLSIQSRVAEGTEVVVRIPLLGVKK